MQYECQRCSKVLELPKKQTNGAVRKNHACEICNDITTFERIGHDYSDMTDAQRDFLRSIHPQVRVTKTSKSQKSIHIDGGESSLCNHEMDSRVVDVSAYPLGYLDWCQHCLARSKDKRKDVSEGSETTEEACRKAIQLAHERVNGEITKREFKDMSIYPSVWSIEKTFGTWSKAKEESL
jgi:hypothetical protein